FASTSRSFEAWQLPHGAWGRRPREPAGEPCARGPGAVKRIAMMPMLGHSDTLEDSTGEYPTMAEAPLPRVAVTFDALTHPGKVRENNEDHFLVARLSKSMHVCKTSLPGDGKTQSSEEEGYLVIVADGMGGVAAGERASALAVESVEGFVQNTLK